MMDLVDIGANLPHDAFDPDRAAVLDRARAAGVAGLVVTGSSLSCSLQALGLARAHPALLRCTAGVHPHHAADHDPTQLDELARLWAAPEVVAIGETGLDFFRDFPRARCRNASSSGIWNRRRTTVCRCSCTNAKPTRAFCRCPRRA